MFGSIESFAESTEAFPLGTRMTLGKRKIPGKAGMSGVLKECLVFYIEIPARLWYNILHRRCAVGFEANCVQAGCLFFHPPVRVS